jgi:hypothetical protein
MVFDELLNGIRIAYFITSSSKEVHLKPILEMLAIIINNARAESNVVQYVLHSPSIFHVISET